MSAALPLRATATGAVAAVAAAVASSLPSIDFITIPDDDDDDDDAGDDDEDEDEDEDETEPLGEASRRGMMHVSASAAPARTLTSVAPPFVPRVRTSASAASSASASASVGSAAAAAIVALDESGSDDEYSDAGDESLSSDSEDDRHSRADRRAERRCKRAHMDAFAEEGEPEDSGTGSEEEEEEEGEEGSHSDSESDSGPAPGTGANAARTHARSGHAAKRTPAAVRVEAAARFAKRIVRACREYRERAPIDSDDDSAADEAESDTDTETGTSTSASATSGAHMPAGAAGVQISFNILLHQQLHAMDAVAARSVASVSRCIHTRQAALHAQRARERTHVAERRAAKRARAATTSA